MVARRMTEDECGDLSLCRVGDDINKLRLLIIRLMVAKDHKFRVIESQIEEIGPHGVASFKKVVEDHTSLWIRNLADQAIVHAVNMIEDFEKEDMTGLINLIPESSGGNLRVEDMTPTQLAIYKGA